jgi:BTB/POZ domain
MDDPEDDITFVTFHNILYYIYTGTVNLHLRPKEQEYDDFPDGYPDEADPYSLYRSADRFLLPSLKERCYTHLIRGITPENAGKRLFHKECEYYEDLKTLYLDYVIANYDKVKVTEGWKEAILNEDGASPSVINYRNRLFYEISQKVLGTKSP